MESSQQYSSLPTKTSIRLLHLQRGIDKENTKIRCLLTVHELDQAPEYESLSYVWGDPNRSEEISLNGHPFHIGLNLAAALRQLRPLKYRIRDRLCPSERILWVDALCINQLDLEEKAHQVKEMAQIYKTAKRVLIWLG
ncbi:HET-domain-containing protein, partial [Cadophora sp. DSE1049]